jgi:2-dehydropantoate 2-reductase
VHEGTDTWSSRVATAARERGPEDAPLALVLVKSHQTAAVAPAVARALAPAGVAVTLQNGLGNREVLESALGRGRVAVGVVTLGARLLGPGEVRVVPGRVLLGEESATGDVVRGLARRLGGAGFEAGTTRNVESVVWAKLVVNCAINPLSALLGVPNGGLLDDPRARGEMRAAALEVAAVARARGVVLEGGAGALAERVARETASNRSSMLQDLERGATTEIDALCGAVAAEGERRGVPTPVNERLWRRVRAREGRPVGEPAGSPGPIPGGDGSPASGGRS